LDRRVNAVAAAYAARLDRWTDDDWQPAEDALASAGTPAKLAPPPVICSAFVYARLTRINVLMTFRKIITRVSWSFGLSRPTLSPRGVGCLASAELTFCRCQ
jgi:hypothetical protein